MIKGIEAVLNEVAGHIVVETCDGGGKEAEMLVT